jgi:multidrug efflux pump subunit AcrA (membrane-fusion protein)
VPVSDANTRSFIARMDVANDGYRLAPGMSARLVFALADSGAPPVLQVPADAVVRRADGSAMVWLVRDGKAKSAPVGVGRRVGDLVEISVSGGEVRRGDLVVTLGNESLVEGEALSYVEN